MALQKGSCLCGAIRYEFDAAPVMAANCYCRDCQKATGSPGTTIIAIPKASLVLTQEKPGAFTVSSDAGREVTRLFCPTCGSQMFTEAELNPDLVFIKVMTLDDPASITPDTSYWVSSAPSWVPIDHSLAIFEQNP